MTRDSPEEGGLFRWGGSCQGRLADHQVPHKPISLSFIGSPLGFRDEPDSNADRAESLLAARLLL